MGLELPQIFPLEHGPVAQRAGFRGLLALLVDAGDGVREGRLKVPDAVAREIRRKEDRLKVWVDRHKRDCVVRPPPEALAILTRIARKYRHYLGEKAGAADPIVVCMAIYYRDSPLTPLTDDTGIQAVCHLENVRFVTSGTFRSLERI